MKNLKPCKRGRQSSAIVLYVNISHSQLQAMQTNITQTLAINIVFQRILRNT